MQKEFFRVEHTGEFKGHFSDKAFSDFNEAFDYREEIKGRGNVEYWNKVYEETRIVKVTEHIEEMKL